MTEFFDQLPKNHFGAILADPPWAFQTWWSGRSSKLPSPKKKFSYPSRATKPAYEVMREDELNALPVGSLAALGYGQNGERIPIVEIDTLEGTMTAAPGDWIIRGIKGELYPCKPDIFAATYDPVSD